MQLSDRVLSRRYATAFYMAATERHEEEKAAADLAQAYRALRNKMAIFKHPRVNPADKKSQMRRLLGGSVSERTTRFLELLIDKKRFDLLPNLAADFGRILDQHRGILHAIVRSAADLSDKEAAAIKQRLKRFSGKSVVLDLKVDPELLAGIVVRMGDWVFDASLQNQLKALTGKLAGGES